MSLQGQAANRQTVRARSQENCDNFLAQAMQEAVFWARGEVNKDGSDLFALTRKKDLGSTTLTVPAAALPSITAELGRETGFTLGSITVSQVRWGAVALNPLEAVAYETAGMLRFSGTITGPQGTSASELFDLDYRAALTTVPRPFDLFTFYLHDASFLLGHRARGGSANATIESAVRMMAEIKGQYQRLYDKLTWGINKADRASRKKRLSKSKRRRAARLRDQMKVMREDVRIAMNPPIWPATPLWYMHEEGTDTRARTNELHAFSNPLTVYSLDPTADLSRFDLPSKIGPLVDAIDARAPDREAAKAAVNAAESEAENENLEPLITANRQMLMIMADDLRDTHQMLTEYKAFQDGIIEVSGAPRKELEDRFRRLQMGESQHKAHFVFKDAVEASEFLSRSPSPSGYVYVADVTKPLEVEIDDHVGRLVVASAFDIVVKRARVRSGGQNSLAFLAGRNLEVQDSSPQAAMVAVGGRFEGPSGPWEGALIKRTFVDEAEVLDSLRANLTRQDAIASSPAGYPTRPGPLDTAQHVALGPLPLYRREAP